MRVSLQTDTEGRSQVDRRIRLIENEVNALGNSLQAVQSLLSNWKQNEERGHSPAIPEQSIRTMKLSVNGMRSNLSDIDEILDSTDD